MLYRFKSKASGDVLMMQAHAEQVLRAMGRDASARGIVTADQQAEVLKALQAAIAADDAARAGNNTGKSAANEASDAPQDADALSLRRRAWPMVDMLERAMTERVDIVWGV